MKTLFALFGAFIAGAMAKMYIDEQAKKQDEEVTSS